MSSHDLNKSRFRIVEDGPDGVMTTHTFLIVENQPHRAGNMALNPGRPEALAGASRSIADVMHVT